MRLVKYLEYYMMSNRDIEFTSSFTFSVNHEMQHLDCFTIGDVLYNMNLKMDFLFIFLVTNYFVIQALIQGEQWEQLRR